jgi:hypothetical protein
MNTKIDPRKPTKTFTPPGFGVRALCAAFLMAPVLLGACLSLQINGLFTFCPRLFTFVHDKKSFQKNFADRSHNLVPQILGSSTTR